MREPRENLGPHPIFEKLDKLSFLFEWLRLFYPEAKGIKTPYLLYHFFPQKILRINGRVPFPVHFTSRVLYHKNIKRGYKCEIGTNMGCYIQARNGIICGNNVRVGPGVGILSINHSVDDYDVWEKAEPIRIGNNVWIGMNSVILPEVEIGNNVVVSAGSVVSRDIPSNTIAAGNPCRVIRQKEPYRGKEYNERD